MKKLVLTVDDSRMMREMLMMVLAEAGFEVAQAEDGEDGLSVLSRCATDINMPKLDGFGFIERVRASDVYRATPILVLSTEGEPAKKLRARAAGATGWIVKPFDAVKLVDAVRRVSA